MMDKVKSGEEILNEFFNDITKIDGVDIDISQLIANLYYEGRLTDTNAKNELENLREKNDNKN